MSVFNVIGKHWPDGGPVGLGVDSTTFTVTPPNKQIFNKTAAEFVTSMDGTQQYQFLFWNTGRHLTRKRSVNWNFSLPGWPTWTATKWYGTPPGSSTSAGPPRVRADALTIRGDAPLSGTPIDATASTYAAGAYVLPPAGDDHVILTAAGGANVVAKDPFPGCGIVGPQEVTVVERPPVRGSTDYLSFGRVDFSYAVSSCDFAGWLELQWGGEDTGDFPETDTLSDGITSGFGVYDHLVGGSFPVVQGASADIIAAYGIGTHYITYSAPTREWIYDVPFPPNPLNILRDLVREGLVRLPKSTDLDLLIKDVPHMNREELGRAMGALEATLDRGKNALALIKKQMERGGH